MTVCSIQEEEQNDSSLFQSKISKKLPMVVSGKGIRIVIEDPYTKERRAVIDGTTGAAVGSLGHGDEEVISQIKDMVGDCFYSFTTGISNYHAENLSNFLINQCPKNAFSSALFVNSGSEANEANMKIAHQYHHEKGDYNRTIFISREKSYHGYTLNCMNISGTRVDEWKEMISPSPKVSNVYPYREMNIDENEKQYCQRLLTELDEKFKQIGPDKIVAFVTEPVSSSTLGTVPPLPGYLDGVRKICDKYGALLIMDEVMCGSGRCGTFCTWAQYMDLNNGPDLQSNGKSLGNGFVTISASLISPKVKNAFVKGSNFLKGGQTYHSHAFNCRVTLAVQEKIKRDGLIENIYKTGNYMGQQLIDRFLKSELNSTSNKNKIVGNIRGRGGFWSIELVKDRSTKEMFTKEDKIYELVNNVCLKNGLACMVIGGLEEKVGDHIILAPAFTLTKSEADEIVDILDKSISEVEAKIF
ncbi:hypothetical protein PACTADRAFT_36614 [Pachysolen tannophilus NRRL Y-2460]|uniref:PLP-dependent transferase n=1 Tax=Pachysolen tannophilus NRRL Y-2460 TaxID=669874 RepID=A0A1E4U2A6_PACTA|nr:hypothetical protein PACTADRAFT_36614 [Pachysolen tannophilus NRRL Y-2460]